MVTTETRRSTATLARWVVGMLLIGHGLIHILGLLEIWGIADIEELTGQPSIGIDQTAADIIATGWLTAFAILAIAGIGVLARKAWWRTWAIVGVVLSQTMIVIWWADAATGTIPNLLVVASVFLSRRLGIDYTQGSRT